MQFTKETHIDSTMPIMVHLHGKVIAFETGLPLEGVHIQIKNKSGGKTTDVNGEFEYLGLNADDLVIFSYQGKQQITKAVNVQTPYEFSITEELEEVELNTPKASKKNVGKYILISLGVLTGLALLKEDKPKKVVL